MSDQIIYPFTDYQISSLAAYYHHQHSRMLRIHDVAYCTDGNIIIRFEKDGEMRKQLIPQELPK